MGDNLDVRLLKRSLGATARNRSVKTLYGHKTWAEDLDIVNELGGHTGCVNALSWSATGNLLASGSDDRYLNIWDYNPSAVASPFSLNTSVSTGHHANIFSVKFMPHSNDRTVVTCAGDSEVRVFDLEYAPSAPTQATSFDNHASSTRSRKFSNFFPNTRWLNESNTNARVYKSHADRAKRIVTESSPHLFLTCSEDGEVRQWDLRQPSSAYPPPRHSRAYRRYYGNADPAAGEPPPPLVSYKKYGLDLNTISCAASQPQYIALGGAHLHCFLHDRRMLGRDLDEEQGQFHARKPVVGTYEDEAMAQATRCVRRFAPNNRWRMKPHDHGHITACKISDANPNDMVVSWSGDYIYSFDIVKSPDARNAEAEANERFHTGRSRNHLDRKRKRAKATASSSSLGDVANPSRRLRRVSDTRQADEQNALLAAFDNGDSELIPLDSDEPTPGAPRHQTQPVVLTPAQISSQALARSLTRLRQTLFDFNTSATQADVAIAMEQSSEFTPHTAALTDALGQTASLLPQIDEIIRTWAYPVNPSPEDVSFQNTLRRNRQATWRFVQASGCLARTLGGRLQTLGSSPDPRLSLFDHIKPAIHEGKNVDEQARFCYDFVKAILLWLDGGQEAVLQGFKRPSTVSGQSSRFPLDDADTVHTFGSKLNAYLLGLARDDVAVIDMDTNRFERDDTRVVFASQKSAVLAFTRALAGVRLESRQGMSEWEEGSSSADTKRVMDKGAAVRFWGVRVGRSLIMRAAEQVTFNFVNRAFGGLTSTESLEGDEEEGSEQEIDPEEHHERIVDTMDLVTTAHGPHVMGDDDNIFNSAVAEDPDEEEQSEDDDDSSESEDSDDEDEDDPEPFFLRRRYSRFRDRHSVNLDVPYSSHTKVYQGHCNTRTVKDVNYFGLNDEYVVSGSDDGNFFIWDRKTCKIVNILEGDGEVVNVVQGHPYEPMIACSGIDSTVKIFGPGGDSRDREAAEKGIDIATPAASIASSSHTRRRLDDDEDGVSTDGTAHAGRGLRSRRAMHRMEEITSQNDVDQRRSTGDAFITVGPMEELLARAWIMSSLRLMT
ncbi:hypothetical protein B0A52_04706 [Exophiala mesophila]|uniref:Uncharacterized protein n=1 Tax=Exophiala mesophila TaxID=212818 RepID=A0A438N953_EXOME|nr:hypothetical protein B0A52_04706 [Exophiala mesophila]